jgi:hypothetical protein
MTPGPDVKETATADEPTGTTVSAAKPPEAEIPKANSAPENANSSGVTPDSAAKGINGGAGVDEIRAAIARLEAQIANMTTSSPSPLPPFFSSGAFFMMVGAVILFLAYLTMGPASAIFSFILVVIGVAILLFGTGTQSMGEFSSDPAAAGYKVKLAGGAGVLAFCIAVGIVTKYADMKQAFQIERKYFTVQVEPKSDGYSKFDNFAAELSINGNSLPVMRKGDYIIVYVPYLVTELRSRRTVAYSFRALEGRPRNAKLAVEVSGKFTVDLGDTESSDASFDFPLSKAHPNIDLSNPSPSQILIDTTDKNKPQGADTKDVPPPALPSAGNA